jgi:WD40 repeat protein
LAQADNPDEHKPAFQGAGTNNDLSDHAEASLAPDEQLRVATENQPQPVNGEPAGRRRRTLLIGALVVVALCFAAGIGYTVARLGRNKYETAVHQLTFQPGIVRAARFRSDGRNVVYAAAWQGSSLELYETSLDRPESGKLFASDLPSPQSELLAVSSASKLAILLNPHFSRDAQIGMLAVQGIYESRPGTIFANVSSADWSPDGSTLAYTTNDSNAGSTIKTYSLARHEDRVIYPASTYVSGWFSGVRFSPNGRLLAFEQHMTNGIGYVVIMNLADKSTRTSAVYPDLAGLAWSPDGKEIWFTAAKTGIIRGIHAMNTAGRERLVYVAPVQLTLQDISKNGDVLVVRNFDSSIISVDHLRGQTPASEIPGYDWPVLGDLSNDGQRIVFGESGEALPRPSLFIRSPDDAHIKPLGEAALPASISPNGSAVLALSNEQCTRVVMFAPDQPSQTLTAANMCVTSVSWLPNGKQFIFAGAKQGQSNRCYLQSLDRSGMRAITSDNFRCDLISPDGAYTLANSGNDFYKVAIDKAEAPIKVKFPAHFVPIRWIAADRVFAIEEFGFSEIDTIDLTSGAIVDKTPIRLPSGVDSVSILKIGADNNTFAYSAVRRSSDLYVIQGLR